MKELIAEIIEKLYATGGLWHGYRMSLLGLLCYMGTAGVVWFSAR